MRVFFLVKVSFTERQNACFNDNITTSLIKIPSKVSIELNLLKVNHSYLMKNPFDLGLPQHYRISWHHRNFYARNNQIYPLQTEIESRTLFSTVATALSTSHLTSSEIHFSSVCILTWKLRLVTKLFVLLETTISSAVPTLYAFWKFMLLFPETKSSSVSCNWLRGLLYVGFFWRVEAIPVLLIELDQILNLFQQLERRTKSQQKFGFKNWCDFEWLIAVKSRNGMKFSLGQLSLISSSVDLVFVIQSGQFASWCHNCNYNYKLQPTSKDNCRMLHDAI